MIDERLEWVDSVRQEEIDHKAEVRAAWRFNGTEMTNPILEARRGREAGWLGSTQTHHEPTDRERTWNNMSDPVVPPTVEPTLHLNTLGPLEVDPATGRTRMSSARVAGPMREVPPEALAFREAQARVFAGPNAAIAAIPRPTPPRTKEQIDAIFNAEFPKGGK